MKEPLPILNDDEQAEAFVGSADLTRFDLGGMQRATFEFSPKTRQVNMRVSEQLLEAVKARAAERGMSYQRFIRQALESAVHKA